MDRIRDPYLFSSSTNTLDLLILFLLLSLVQHSWIGSGTLVIIAVGFKRQCFQRLLRYWRALAPSRSSCADMASSPTRSKSGEAAVSVNLFPMLIEVWTSSIHLIAKCKDISFFAKKTVTIIEAQYIMFITESYETIPAAKFDWIILQKKAVKHNFVFILILLSSRYIS